MLVSLGAALAKTGGAGGGVHHPSGEEPPVKAEA